MDQLENQDLQDPPDPDQSRDRRAYLGKPVSQVNRDLQVHQDRQDPGELLVPEETQEHQALLVTEERPVAQELEANRGQQDRLVRQDHKDHQAHRDKLETLDHQVNKFT